MSESPVPRPLEGDALRIQQLTAKLAQVRQDQHFFNPQAPRSSGRTFVSPGVPENLNTPSDDQSDAHRNLGVDGQEYQTKDKPGQPEAGTGFGTQKLSFVDQSAPTAKKSVRRQAPMIEPAMAKSGGSYQRSQNHFRLFHSTTQAYSSEPRTYSAEINPSSDVVPFLYQNVNGPRPSGYAEISPTPSPTHEIPNPFDNAPATIHSAVHVSQSSPLNPNKGSNSNTLARTRSRRDAADLSAGPTLQPKQSRGFFNNFMHKKKRDHGAAPDKQASPSDKINHDHFTSPFETANQQTRSLRGSQNYAASLTSLRVPSMRRQSSQTESAVQRVKLSVVSMDKSPGSSISTSGITLDTDMSRMAGIVKESTNNVLPRPDFTFGNDTNASSQVVPIEDFGEAAWAPPESWAVRRPEDIARDDAFIDDPDPLDAPPGSLRKESRLSAITSASDQQLKKGPNHQMRIFRGDWTFATVACGLQTTTESLMATLGRKFFLHSVTNYQILIERNGLSRILQAWEKPFVLQKTLLEEAGYTEQDRLEEVGREDNSYLCRFIFTTCSVPSFSLVIVLLWCAYSSH